MLTAERVEAMPWGLWGSRGHPSSAHSPWHLSRRHLQTEQLHVLKLMKRPLPPDLVDLLYNEIMVSS